MRKDKNIPLEQLVAKIDNDFNPDNSDWIPRVGAWAIDAMQMIDCLPTKKVKVKVKVVDRIVNTGCKFGDGCKVYDMCGNEIKEYNGEDCKRHCCRSTGEKDESFNEEDLKNDPDIENKGDSFDTAERIIARKNRDDEYKPPFSDYYLKHSVIDVYKSYINKNYVKISCNQLELNFHTPFVFVECEKVETYCSDNYGCELPYIPNNGLVIEAIACYCMYKMLCRGYKHPVLNLQASQYGTNPYFMWQSLREEAKRSYINNIVDNTNIDELWRSAFYISAFDPKRN